jgi:hypothetical protein
MLKNLSINLKYILNLKHTTFHIKKRSLIFPYRYYGEIINIKKQSLTSKYLKQKDKGINKKSKLMS